MRLSFRRTAHGRLRRGFSLVEVMMAMTMLAIILMSLARMGLLMAKRSRDNGIVAKRTFALIKEANKFGAMPYTTLSTFDLTTTSKTDGTGSSAFTYTRRLDRTITGSRLAFKIVVIPTQDVTRVDSVFVYRSLPPGSPLCLGC